MAAREVVQLCLLLMEFNENSSNNVNPNETQSTAICTCPWHLSHLAMVLILEDSFLVPLFLFGCSAFFSLTSFLSGSGRVLDLWGWVGEGRSRHWYSLMSSGLEVIPGIWLYWWKRGRRLFTRWSTTFILWFWISQVWIMLSHIANMISSFATIWASLVGSIRVIRDWLDSPKGKRRYDPKLCVKLIFCLFFYKFYFVLNKILDCKCKKTNKSV